MLIEMVWSQSHGFLTYTSNERRLFSEILSVIHDNLYTDKPANPEICDARDGNNVKDATTLKCTSAQRLLRHRLHGNKKSIRVQIGCDSVLHGDGAVQRTFDNFILHAVEVELATGSTTRFASDHTTRIYLESRGEDGIDEQAQDLEKDTGSDDNAHNDQY